MKKMNKWVSLFAMMGAMMASESKGKDSVDVMEEVFGQERVAITEIDGVTVSLTDGEYSRKIEVPNILTTTDGQVITNGTKEANCYYPILREANGQGFASGYTEVPKFADIAINKDRKEIWASAEGTTNTLFKISLEGISTNNMFGSSMAIQPELLRNSITNDQDIAQVKADKLITFGDWILTFGQKKNAANTKVFHINGVANNRTSFSSIIPTTHCETADKLYMTDGSRTVWLDKNNPTNGIKNVETTATDEIVGLAALKGTLYQATSTAIYKESDNVLTKGILYSKKTGSAVMPFNTNCMTADGSCLIISYNSNEKFEVEECSLDGKDDVLAVKGASKVFATQNGIQALVNNKLVHVR